MALNRYFKQGSRSEQNLYEDLILESIQIHGLDFQYLPREVVEKDMVTGEDIISRFDDAYTIEMYVENIDGFDGEDDLYAKFGVEIRDAATLVVARRRFEQTVATYEDDIDHPREGDLLYFPFSNNIFEISKVQDDQPFYQLRDLNVYKLRVEMYEYSGEDFDTGIDTIDDVELFGYNQKLTLKDSGAPDWDVGEEVVYYAQDSENGPTLTGEITDWDGSTNVLTISQIRSSDGVFREFRAGDTITSTESNDTRTISIVNDDLSVEDSFNSDYSDDISGIFDTSINNPFGNIS